MSESAKRSAGDSAERELGEAGPVPEGEGADEAGAPVECADAARAAGRGAAREEATAESPTEPGGPEPAGGGGVRQVLRQHWREFLLEGVAVLLGVLLAFAVDAYGQRAGERRSEEIYLLALAEEVRANDAQLRDLAALTRTRMEDVEIYLTTVVHAPAEEPPSIASLNEMLTQVGPFRTSTYQRGALDDLLTSGGIELVRSAELRRSILVYAQLVEQEGVRQEAALRFWEDHMAPYYYEHASFFDFMDWLEVPGESIPGAVNLDAFYRSPEYSNLLIERRVRDVSLLAAREALAVHMDALLARLPGEGDGVARAAEGGEIVSDDSGTGETTEGAATVP